MDNPPARVSSLANSQHSVSDGSTFPQSGSDSRSPARVAIAFPERSRRTSRIRLYFCLFGVFQLVIIIATILLTAHLIESLLAEEDTNDVKSFLQRTPTNELSTSDVESTAWLNLLVEQTFDAYRMTLNDSSTGEGTMKVTKVVETLMNEQSKKQGLAAVEMGYIKVAPIRHLGASRPYLANPRVKTGKAKYWEEEERHAQFSFTYADNLTLSISGLATMNLPYRNFRILPVSLNVIFRSISGDLAIRLLPLSGPDGEPTLLVSLRKGFTMDLRVEPTVGSVKNLPLLPSIVEGRMRAAMKETVVWPKGLRIKLPGWSEL